MTSLVSYSTWQPPFKTPPSPLHSTHVCPLCDRLILNPCLQNPLSPKALPAVVWVDHCVWTCACVRYVIITFLISVLTSQRQIPGLNPKTRWWCLSQILFQTYFSRHLTRSHTQLSLSAFQQTKWVKTAQLLHVDRKRTQHMFCPVFIYLWTFFLPLF